MWFSDWLLIGMFITLFLLIFTGYPVAMVLGAVGIYFGAIAAWSGEMSWLAFYSIAPRIWGSTAENLVLVAAPMFVFMGTMLEKSRVATDLLLALQVLLRRFPGGLALAVMLVGTIMAAATGIIGASVVMLTMMALPTMLERGYSKSLSTGTIGAAGCLGILIPPSIMLIIVGELLQVSVGRLFMAAMVPGLMLALLYLIYIGAITWFRPHLAPPLTEDERPESTTKLLLLLLRSFLPPSFLICLVLGSIFMGWATPTEAAGVGAAGSTFLALINGRLSFKLLREVVETTALMSAMVFLIFFGATIFSFVFRSLGGDDLVVRALDLYNFGSYATLFVFLGLIFFMGFFFDWIEICLITLPIFGPVLAILDFGHGLGQSWTLPWIVTLIAVTLQTSFLTPPFAFALFYIKGAAPSSITVRDLYTGVIPFVLLQLLCLILILIFPQIAVWLPQQFF